MKVVANLCPSRQKAPPAPPPVVRHLTPTEAAYVLVRALMCPPPKNESGGHE
jgi:hypothetical protein